MNGCNPTEKLPTPASNERGLTQGALGRNLDNADDGPISPVGVEECRCNVQQTARCGQRSGGDQDVEAAVA
jgi:hypothetical protein